MKCKECPLYGVEYSPGCEEWDEVCAAGEYFGWDGVDSENGGCRRTNKWILAQNKLDIINKRLEEECDHMEAYNLYGEENERRAEEQGWTLHREPGYYHFTKGDEFVEYYKINEHIENPVTVDEVWKRFKKEKRNGRIKDDL